MVQFCCEGEAVLENLRSVMCVSVCVCVLLNILGDRL